MNADYSTNPLLQAIKSNSTESALLLLEHEKVDINSCGYGLYEQNEEAFKNRLSDENFGYPIIEAIINENVEIVDKLLSFPNIKLKTKHSYDSPFIYVIEMGNLDIIKSFLDHGKADLDLVGRISNC